MGRRAVKAAVNGGRTAHSPVEFKVGDKGVSMFRICKDKENPYVMLNKEFLNDKDLSAKSKGVLAYLLSLPDDWKIYENEIITHFSDGRDSIRSGIKELIKNGYIERERCRNEHGHLKGWNYCVYEVSTKDGKSNIGKSDTTNNNITNIPKKKNVKRKRPVLTNEDIQVLKTVKGFM